VIEHEDRPSPDKWCALRRGSDGGPDRLEVSYHPDPDEIRWQASAEKRLMRMVRRLGCWPLRRIDPGHGASIHYGATLPMSVQDRELTVAPECLLRGTSSVYLVDGSVLPWLPSKPLTFTLMANGDRVGRRLASELR